MKKSKDFFRFVPISGVFVTLLHSRGTWIPWAWRPLGAASCIRQLTIDIWKPTLNIQLSSNANQGPTRQLTKSTGMDELDRGRSADFQSADRPSFHCPMFSTHGGGCRVFRVFRGSSPSSSFASFAYVAIWAVPVPGNHFCTFSAPFCTFLAESFLLHRCGATTYDQELRHRP